MGVLWLTRGLLAFYVWGMNTTGSSAGPLDGLCIASFESRQSIEMATLIQKRGGTAMRAPTMQEVPLEDNAEALEFGEALMGGKCDALVVLTGIGTKILIEALLTRWAREEVLEALEKTCIIARSGKPVATLKKYKLKAQHIAEEPNTWKELLEEVDAHYPVSGKHLFIQEYGETNVRLVEGLEERGARVTTVPVYAWQLPDDTTLLEEAIAAVVDGKVDCVVFTSAHQINNLRVVAERCGVWAALERVLCEWVVVASVGPFTGEAIAAAGLPVEICPERPKMGYLIKAVTEEVVARVAQKRAGKDFPRA